MKKMCIIMLALMLVLTLFSGTALAATPVQPPEGDFTRYNNSDGTVTITEYKGTAKDIIIPNTLGGKTVTVIGVRAFANKQLTSVVIPDSVKTINESAFANNQLTSVTIPSKVTTIGRYAFEDNQLTSVVIPSSVTGIGNAAFGNNRLTSVVIPYGVTTIGERVFENNQLESVTIPDSVTSIGERAFYGNRLTSVEIPSNVTTIGDQAFYGNQLTSVTIPDKVTTIGGGAFGNNRLTSVVIPSSVTGIGNAAFGNNRLTSVTISDGVTTIGNYAFRYNQLTSVTIPSSVTTIGDWAFTENKLTSVTISDGVTTIGDYAFADNQLTSVTIPDSVTTIGSEAFAYNQLTDVTIKNADVTINITTFISNQANPLNFTIYGHDPSTAKDHANQLRYTFVDLRAPATFSANMTEPTNQNVTVTINYSANAAVKQYKINSGSWQNYTSPVVMTDNGTIYARSQSAGIWSEESSYTVSNIDKTPPDQPTITPSTTSPTTGSVVLTISYPADATIKEYKIGQEGDWYLYVEPVPVASNATVYARATDAAGNTSESQYEVDNIITDKPAMPDINIYGNTITITTTDNPDTVTLYYKVNEGSWEEYSGPFTLPTGTYTIEAKAVDENDVESEISFIENVDITEPDDDQGEPPNGDESGSGDDSDNGDGSGDGDDSDNGDGSGDGDDQEEPPVTVPVCDGNTCNILPGMNKIIKNHFVVANREEQVDVSDLVPKNYDQVVSLWK